MNTTTDVEVAPGVVGIPHWFLRLEALALLISSGWGYQATHGNWTLFAILFLAPDISMLGYLVNSRVGAISYNIAHTTVVYGIIGGIGYIAKQPLTLEVGLIGLAHVGFDRLVGYGLKYPEAFGLTHLGRVGKVAK